MSKLVSELGLRCRSRLCWCKAVVDVPCGPWTVIFGHCEVCKGCVKGIAEDQPQLCLMLSTVSSHFAQACMFEMHMCYNVHAETCGTCMQAGDVKKTADYVAQVSLRSLLGVWLLQQGCVRGDGLVSTLQQATPAALNF